MGAVSLSVLLALAAAAPAARGDEAASPKTLYEQGQTEFELGHYKEAIARWEAAYRLHPVPAALYNLGQAYYKIGDLEQAAHSFKTLIVKLKEGKNVELAKNRLQQIEEDLKARPASGVGGDSLLTVAVAPFRTEGVDPGLAWLGKSFADALQSRLQKARTVRVVEREFLDQVMTEMKLQSSSLIDEKSAVRVGRILGARVIVFGSVAVLGDEAVARARIVSVERAEVLGSGEAQGAVKQLFGLQAELGKQVAQAMSLSAALSDRGGPEVTELTLAAYADLDRLRELARGLPFLGADPLRRRRSGDYQLALSLSDKLIAAHPKLAPARLYRGLFSLQTDDLDRAEQEAVLAVRLAPDNLDAWALQANVKYLRGELDEAMRQYRSLSEKFPDDARAFYAAGRVALQQGAKLQAVPAFLAALQRTPFLPEAESNLRTLVSAPDAAPLLEALRAQDPGAQAAALAYRGFFAGLPPGQELTAGLVRDMPRLYLGYYLQGLSAKGVPAQEAAFRSALALRGSFPEAHRELGRVLLASRRCDEGSDHVDLYLRTAAAVSDYGPLQEQKKSCREDSK